MADTDVKNATVKIPVTLTVSGVVYAGTFAARYNSREGKVGRFKLLVL